MDLYFLLISYILEKSLDASFNIISYLIYYIKLGNLSLESSFDIISYLIYYSIIGNLFFFSLLIKFLSVNDKFILLIKCLSVNDKLIPG